MHSDCITNLYFFEFPLCISMIIIKMNEFQKIIILKNLT